MIIAGWVAAPRALLYDESLRNVVDYGLYLRLAQMAAREPRPLLYKGYRFELLPGQIAVSRSDLRAVTGLTDKELRCSIQRLVRAKKLAQERGQEEGQARGQGRAKEVGQAAPRPPMLLTILNYEEIFSPRAHDWAAKGQGNGADDEQTGAKNGATEQKEEKVYKNQETEIGPNSTAEIVELRHTGRDGKRYAFAAEIVRVNDADLATWRRAYWAIPDIEAELWRLDSWLVQEATPAQRKKWFQLVSGALAKKHQEWVAKRKEAQAAAEAAKPPRRYPDVTDYAIEWFEYRSFPPPPGCRSTRDLIDNGYPPGYRERMAAAADKLEAARPRIKPGDIARLMAEEQERLRLEMEAKRRAAR
jgi:hypothetical protein